MIHSVYPDYRNSKIEWLDKVPVHWRNVPIKYMALGKESLFLDGDWIESKDISGDDIRYITTGNVGEGRYKEQGLGFISEDKFKQLDCTEVFEDDILISRLNAPIGRSCLVPNLKSKIVTSVDNVIFRPDVKYHKQFVVHLFSSKDYFKHTSNLARGATMQRISRGLLGNIRIIIPPYDEQQKIANFLDHETAKIDTLIDKQQQLIKLLKEKRQAVISHAVTKGLNPNAPMRDSGVEWLGEVPEHWDVRRINLIFSESNARAKTAEELTYPVLSVSIHHGISDKELNEEELDRKVQRSEDRSLYKVVHSNFLAYNMMRAWQGGFGASKLSGLVSPAYVVCPPKTNLNSYYFELSLRTSNAVTELKRFSRGITDFRLRLYWDEFKNISVPVPPKDEILTILQSIFDINSTYDNLGNVAERQIELLKERRTALISAAVTGKIDVRNWIAPEPLNNNKKEVA